MAINALHRVFLTLQKYASHEAYYNSKILKFYNFNSNIGVTELVFFYQGLKDKTSRVFLAGHIVVMVTNCNMFTKNCAVFLIP